MRVQLDVQGLKGDRLLKRLNLQSGGSVQQAIDSAVIRFSMPYVPMKRGVLAQAAWSATDIGSGQVIWSGPYAHYQWAGEVYGPNFPVEFNSLGQPVDWRSPKGIQKRPTGRRLNYRRDLNRLAGDHWTDRMKQDRMDDIIVEAVKKLGK